MSPLELLEAASSDGGARPERPVPRAELPQARQAGRRGRRWGRRGRSRGRRAGRHVGQRRLLHLVLLPRAPHHQQRADDVQGEREQAGDAEDAEVREPVKSSAPRRCDDRGNGEDDERDGDRPLDVRVRVLEVEDDEHRDGAEEAERADTQSTGGEPDDPPRMMTRAPIPVSRSRGLSLFQISWTCAIEPLPSSTRRYRRAYPVAKGTHLRNR